MNTQLVESLVQVIEALSAEESALLLAKLQTRNIQKTPGICGGQARIRNTRIPVWTLVSLRQQGAGDEEILTNYPGLTQTDLAASWMYYEQHRAEIDQEIAEPEHV